MEEVHTQISWLWT